MGQEKPWTKRLPVLLCAFGAAAGWFALPLVAMAFGNGNQLSLSISSLSKNALLSFAGAGTCGMIGGLVGNQILISKLRPYLRNLVKEHAVEKEQKGAD